MSGRLWQKVRRQKLNSIGSHEIQSVLMYVSNTFSSNNTQILVKFKEQVLVTRKKMRELWGICNLFLAKLVFLWNFLGTGNFSLLLTVPAPMIDVASILKHYFANALRHVFKRGLNSENIFYTFKISSPHQYLIASPSSLR